MYLIISRSYRTRFLAGIVVFLLMLVAFAGKAQPGLSFEIKKPKQFENRPLPSEKTGDTKFSLPKRFYTNTVSRFNYYYNANRILDEVIAEAKQVHQDDYTQLLSFYNYDLSTGFKDPMDTVIYKATAGILLHDLRSDWVDKLYLLMGKAYLYRKDFDSATTVFQYINYAFAPKDDGYDIPIGSNASNTNGVFTISTRESKSLWKKIMSFPPSRNESFLWQARTYLEQGETPEAAGLLELIRVDPNFPERLRTDLEELTAYLLYKRGDYDSSAVHLLKALDNAETKQERARWEYLAAQMFSLSGMNQKAIEQFEKAIEHTSDPLMEVYARLNEVSLSIGNEENALQKHLNELLRMAKRDKYEPQRDIIYYAAAKLELRRFHYAAAEALLKESLRYNTDNATQKQLTLLLLGDMNYNRKFYASSYGFYDSIDVSVLPPIDQRRVTERKPALQVISENQASITREDSLQKLAAMSVEQRNAAAALELKKLRRARGLKDLPTDPAIAADVLGSDNTINPFGNPVTQFYFQNASMRTRGMAEFKQKWGNRPNVDGWRRQNAVDRTLLTATPTNDAAAKVTKDDDLTLDGLLKNIPLSGDQIAGSHQTIIRSLLDNAATFQNKLEDYPSAIEAYEELIKRYPESAEVADALYNLAYLYRKNDQIDKADQATSQLKAGFPASPLVAQLNNSTRATRQSSAAEQTYASIYRMLIEGNFTQAKEAKIAADKQFGKTYWTPQLLYIESIYYIKQKEDSTAINRLQEIVANFKSSPLSEKAATMIDVLGRRKQIEAYLTNLDINLPADERNRGVDLNNPNAIVQQTKKPDSIRAVPQQIKGADPKNLANVSNTHTVAVPGFTKKDSMTVTAPKVMPKQQVLTAPAEKIVTVKGFTFNPADGQYAVVILDKVDPIFATEARNAFNRFNQERYVDLQLNIFNRKINDQYQLLLMGPFANAGDAVGYLDRVKPLAGTRIVPWLAADKYSFMVISDANMNLLVENKDMAGYKALLQEALPGKF
jgi:tetratricopeptide (TPR) repeat protein